MNRDIRKILSRTSAAAGLFSLSTSAIAQTGNVGIGTQSPAARLHVVDSSVLFSAAGFVPNSPASPPASGAGRRMMWYPDKAAFRAGFVSGNLWNKDSIGTYSFATGADNQAGFAAFSAGYANRARADYSTALGNNNWATGNFSFTAGNNNQALGQASTAIGQFAYVSGSGAAGIGRSDTATGAASVALGLGVYARSAGEVAVGTYNEDYTPFSATSPHPGDRAFVVGNGLGENARSNAFTIMRNGAVGIGTNTPAQPFHIVRPDYSAYNGVRFEDNAGPNATVFTITPGYSGMIAEPGAVTLDIPNAGKLVVGDNLIPDADNSLALGMPGRRWAALFATNGTIQTSDIRLKKDVEPLRYGLEKVLAIRPFTFNWKDNSNTQRKLGFSAQELQALMPELVSVGDDEAKTLGVNYGELVPVLVHAIQEQQKIIESLRSEVEAVKNELSADKTARQ